MKRIQYIEWLCWALGIFLLLTYVYSKVWSHFQSREGVRKFEQMLLEKQKAPSAESSTGGNVESSDNEHGKVDYNLWSPKRILAYEASLKVKAGLPLAVLRIAKIRLEVPVFEGVDDVTLDRGAGRIPGTALPGRPGNFAVAGHRDGFFRGLKDVVVGDTIEVESLSSSAVYTVDSIVIVKPEDVYVLAPTQAPTLTLVTCYPFYYVGSAPQRYIVKASLTDSNEGQQKNPHQETR